MPDAYSLLLLNAAARYRRFHLAPDFSNPISRNAAWNARIPGKLPYHCGHFIVDRTHP